MENLLEQIKRAKKNLDELTIEPSLIVIAFKIDSLHKLEIFKIREQMPSPMGVLQSLNLVCQVNEYEIYSNYMWQEIPHVYQRLCIQLLSKNDEVVCFSAKVAELAKKDYHLPIAPIFTFSDTFSEHMLKARYFTTKTS